MEIKLIHYHGTPLGGKRTEAVRFFQGRHALVPFSYPDDMAIVAECCQSFCLDNGAFSAWTKGKTVDWSGYVSWVRDWCRHPGFDFALIPDVIDGSEHDNDSLIENWMESTVSSYGVPVWHLHESLDRLVTLAENFRMVALGSSGQWASPGTSSWWERMSQAMDAISDNGKPICKLHGLRMLDPQIFTKLPLASADSTNAAVNSGSLGRFGMYLPPSSGQRAEVIAERIEIFNSSPVWQSPGIQNDLFAA